MRRPNPVNWTALTVGSLVLLGGAGAVAYFATRPKKIPTVIAREVTEAEKLAVLTELPAPPALPPVVNEESSANAPKPKVAQETQGNLSGLQLRAVWTDIGFFTDDDVPLVRGGSFFAPFDGKQYSVATDDTVSPRSFVSFRGDKAPSRNGYSFKLTAIGPDLPVLRLVKPPTVPDTFVYESTLEPGFTLLDSSVKALRKGNLLASFEGFTSAADTRPDARLDLYFEAEGSRT